MPKPKSKKQSQPLTGGEIDQLLANQANVILEAVTEGFTSQGRRIDRLEKTVHQSFNTVITKLDGVIQELQAPREEDVARARQLHQHDDQLLSHEKRITALERRS